MPNSKTMSIGVIITADPGHGKTETALRFQVPGKKQTKRLVLDYEARITQYQGEKDDLKRHLWAFDIYPGEFETPNADQLAALYAGIKDGSIKPDVLIIDNVVLFQDELTLMCSDKGVATKLAQAFGIYDRYKMFIDYNWRIGDAAWWGLVKAIIKELLLTCRKQRINVVVTTELKNVWQNYGSRDKNKPAKILGKTAKLLAPWLQIMDAIWQLSRKVKDDEGKPVMKDAPTVQIDPFSPKASLVGIPPRFEFTDWKQIWQWIEERGAPTKEDFAKVEVPEEEVSVEEVAADAGLVAALETITDSKSLGAWITNTLGMDKGEAFGILKEQFGPYDKSKLEEYIKTLWAAFQGQKPALEKAA